MKRILFLLLVPIVLVSGAVCQQPVGISPLVRYTVSAARGFLCFSTHVLQ